MGALCSLFPDQLYATVWADLVYTALPGHMWDSFPALGADTVATGAGAWLATTTTPAPSTTRAAPATLTLASTCATALPEPVA